MDKEGVLVGGGQLSLEISSRPATATGGEGGAPPPRRLARPLSWTLTTVQRIRCCGQALAGLSPPHRGGELAARGLPPWVQRMQELHQGVRQERWRLRRWRIDHLDFAHCCCPDAQVRLRLPPAGSQWEQHGGASTPYPCWSLHGVCWHQYWHLAHLPHPRMTDAQMIADAQLIGSQCGRGGGGGGGARPPGAGAL